MPRRSGLWRSHLCERILVRPAHPREGAGDARHVVVKVPYQSRSQRYEYHLTPKGADLAPVLRAMAEWANRHIPGTVRPPVGFGGGAERA